MRTIVAALAAVAAGLPLAAAHAAGGGAGAGGAGHQRAINSGLPPGERGPLGAPNNPHAATDTSAAPDTDTGATPTNVSRSR